MTNTGCLLTTSDNEIGPIYLMNGWPRPFGLRRKSGHTSLPASTLEPPKPFGRRPPPHRRRPVDGGPDLVWPDFRSQRRSPR